MRIKKTRRLLVCIIYIIIGSFLYSFAVNTLFIPHGLFSGGLTGIAIILNYLFSLPTEITVIILNIPLFIGSYVYLGCVYFVYPKRPLPKGRKALWTIFT